MTKSFDVFLSHNSRDKPAVRELAEALRARGLKVWLDEWELVPGRPWLEALEEVIETAGASAVLVGKDGLGPWQDAEMQGCLSEFVERKLPVIPVLLPDAPEAPKLPLFLKRFKWVDLRGGLTDKGMDQLEWGITGTKPPEGLTHSSTLMAAPEAQPALPERRPAQRSSHVSRTISQVLRNKWSPPLAVFLAAVIVLVALLARWLESTSGAGEAVSPVSSFPETTRRRFATDPVEPACVPGEERTEEEIIYVRICPGTFTMGSADDDSQAFPDEKPAHQVRLSEFWIGKTEITNEQYRRFRPSHQGTAGLPATNVSWFDAQAACERFGGSLPTEAQWEYAARAGSHVTWSDRNSNGALHPVGTKNAPGLYDMHGNAWEWVADWFGPYPSEAQTNPPGPSEGTYRVLRGGAFGFPPRYLRSAFRGGDRPGLRYWFIGFRCARDPGQ